MKRTMAAFVIGNSNYPGGNKLANPVNDAIDFAAKLASYGFHNIIVTDSTVSKMHKGLKAFAGLLDTHEVGLFFFAGHGVQIEGHNYLLAINSDTADETDAKYSSLPLDKVVDVMARSQTLTKIVVLDACRNNPWERAWNRGPATRGLASVYAPKGTIIGFATSPGEVASDGSGRNGTYTEALLQHIDAPDCSIESMFKRVRNTVAAATSGKQTTWEHTSLSGEFYFNLSLGNLIDEYDGTALADSLFVLDESKTSNQIIAGLKSHNWYRQNPALDRLNAGNAAKMLDKNLFVIGRNIYQASCGDSGSATRFIKEFMAITSEYPKTKRKALLDGILFEVFFDSKGELRESIKDGYFDEVFELQRFPTLKNSFNFIAEALHAAGGEFYVMPGKGQELAVTVSTKTKKKAIYVEAVYVGGVNVLRSGEDTWETAIAAPHHTSVAASTFSSQLSRQMAVPARLFKITYTPASAAKSDSLFIPSGWSVRKVSLAYSGD